MLIGSSFNSKLDDILLTALRISRETNSERIEVEQLNKAIKLDRLEMKNYLEYLSDKNMVALSTIGGPFLYGHIELMPDGVKRAEKIISNKRKAD